MAKLSGPYEILDIEDGETVVFNVLKTESGDVEIHPAYGEATKTVTALRLHLTQSPWPNRLPYVDITSQRLKAMLEGRLARIPFGGQVVQVKKWGVAPKAVFSVEFI